MFIYLFNFLSIPFYDLMIKDKKKIIWLVCVQMFLILALRADTLGPDMRAYSTFYNTWSGYSLGEMIGATRFLSNHEVVYGRESGFVWLCWLCSKIGFSFHDFLVVHAFLCIIGLYYFIKKYAKNKPLTLLFVICFGVFQMFFYILRQTLAFVVLLQSIEFIKKRKMGKFLLIGCVAVMFHRVALPFLFIYFLYGVKITRKLFVLVYAACIGIIIMIKPIYYIFFVPILKMGGMSEDYALGNFKMNNMIILMLLISLYIMIMTNTKYLFEDGNNRIFFWSMSLALVCESISLYVPVYSRVAIALFFPFGLVLFANVINMQKIRTNRLFWITLFLILSSFFYVYQLGRDPYIVPYVSIWG